LAKERKSCEIETAKNAWGGPQNIEPRICEKQQQTDPRRSVRVLGRGL
jgi:hypothetical protein